MRRHPLLLIACSFPLAILLDFVKMMAALCAVFNNIHLDSIYLKSVINSLQHGIKYLYLRKFWGC